MYPHQPQYNTGQLWWLCKDARLLRYSCVTAHLVVVHAEEAWPCSMVHSLHCAAPAFPVGPCYQGTAVAWAGSCSPGEGIASSAEGPLCSSAAGMWSLLPSVPMVAELRLDDEQVSGGSDAAVAAGLMSTMQHVMLSHPAPHSTLSRCLLESTCIPHHAINLVWLEAVSLRRWPQG